MPFKIVRSDITKMNTDAIVNTAAAGLSVGPGCDSAVYLAAGEEKLKNYRKEHIGCVKEGDVFITPGFDLKAKYIIHAVSPLYRGGGMGEERKLRSCYRKSLKIAKENGIRSIAFPLIAAGSFGYPKEEGMRIAADEINSFLLKDDMEVFLVVFGQKETELGKKIYPALESYIDRNYVIAAEREEYAVMQRRPSVMDTGSLPDMKAFSFNRCEAEARESICGKARPREDLPAAKMSKPKDHPAEEICRVEAEVFFDFEEQHESRLEERMKHLSDTYSEYLQYLIREKGMENAEVYKRAIVDKKIFSKIKNNKNYHPNKLTALCLCVGAKLNLDEAKDLLARAGYALSPCDKTDIIFSYFIENEIYDMIELDIQLEEHGLPCIIA